MAANGAPVALDDPAHVHARWRRTRRAGDRVAITALRGGRREELELRVER